MKQSSFVLYNKQHSEFFWFHSLAHITIATKTIHFTVTPIPTCLERPERTNYQLTDSLNFHKGRNYTSCEHAECYKLFTPCTTPAQHLHFPNWTLETGKPTTTIKEKYFHQQNRRWNAESSFFTCSIHATEFNHRNNPVFTAQSPYCTSANRSTFFIT